MGETRVASDDYRAAITMYHFTAESGDDLELSHAVNVVTFLWFTQHVPHTAVWYHRVPPPKHLHCVATALVSHLCLPLLVEPPQEPRPTAVGGSGASRHHAVRHVSEL